MNPRWRAIAQLGVLIILGILLLLLFPRAVAIAELAAREIIYLWWVVLLIALACWLLWAATRKKP